MRERSQWSRQTGLSKAWFAVLPIGILAGLGLAIATRQRDKTPTGDSTPALTAPADESPDWTYTELLHHLRDRGFTIRMSPIGDDYLYVLTESQDDAISVAGQWSQGRRDTQAVLCQKHASSNAAKEEATRLGKNSFAWGRFVFTGDGMSTATLEKFQKALSGGANNAAPGQPEK